MNPEDRIAEILLNAAERVVRMSCFLFCLLLMMGGVWALYDTAQLYYEASDQSVLRFRPQSSGETGNCCSYSADVVIHICLYYIAAVLCDFPNVDSCIGCAEEAVLSDRHMKQSAVQLVHHTPMRHDRYDGL